MGIVGITAKTYIAGLYISTKIKNYSGINQKKLETFPKSSKKIWFLFEAFKNKSTPEKHS